MNGLSMPDVTLWSAILGGIGVAVIFYALLGEQRRRRIVAAQDQIAGAGVGAGLAYDLAYNAGPADAATRIEQQLKAANWFWAPGEPAPPDPQAPFHSVRGYYAAAIYQAVTYGALGLIAGIVMAAVAGVPLLLAPVAALIAGMIGYTTPGGRLATAMRERQHRMQVEMAFRLPELAAVVSTGKSSVTALRQLTARPGGPFTTEMARLLRVNDATTSLEQAVQTVVQHNRFPPLTEYLRQILMVELQGGSLGPTLNVQSENAQSALNRRLLEQGLENAGSMEMPVVVGSLLTTLALVAGPALWYLLNYL